MELRYLAKLPRSRPSGPQPAKILIVGEAPDQTEVRKGEPFVGRGGKELTDMLHSIGLLRTDCRLTYVTHWWPFKNDISKFFLTKTNAAKYGLPALGGKYPNAEIRQGLKELAKEIAQTKPDVIFALGNTALWALTGEWGIGKWRGSDLTLNPVWEGPYDPTIRVIATYSPVAIQKTWEWRNLACYDMQKGLRPPAPEPSWRWTIGTTWNAASATLNILLSRADKATQPLHLAVDIETRERTFIDCIGIAWSSTEALCIPFFKASTYEFFWTIDEEVDLILKLRKLFLHPNVEVTGQNWYYDANYIARLWGFLVTPTFDTMVAHAVAYPGTQKSLDFLSSIYLPWHRYWKDDTAEAEAEVDDLKRWNYNCKDCCITWSLKEPISEVISVNSLQTPWEFERDLFRPLMSMMLKGVRLHEQRKQAYLPEVMEAQAALETFFQELQAEAFPDIQLAKSKTAKPWYRSSQQMVKLFYEHLKLPPQYHKKTRRPTTDDAALSNIAKKEPLFAPLISMIQEYRSLGVFISTFLLMPMDRDKRWRTSYNPVGTETFRFNSSVDSFGVGGNLQNIPVGDD